MNPASILMAYGRITKKSLIAFYISGAPVDLVHAASTVIFLWFMSRPLLEKLERIKRKYGDRCIFDLVGFFEDEYKKQVEQLQSEGIVRFYGFQENPKPYYAQTDCVVLPSYHEGMSNVLLEAAASGRAIITTDIPGCREAVDNGKSGMLCKVKSTDSLYKAMKRFTELSREKRELLGKAGREKMEREFDKKKVVEETVKVITKAMTKQERGMK